MSATLDDLLIRKVDGDTVSMKEYFGLSLETCPMLMPTDVKEPYSTDFKDEDGVDSYNDGVQRFKAFDATFKVVTVTNSPIASHSIIKNLVNYFTTNGSLHEVYSAWAGVGRTKCRFKSVGDFSQHMNKSNEFVVQFSFTLTVEDPVTELPENHFEL